MTPCLSTRLSSERSLGAPLGLVWGLCSILSEYVWVHSAVEPAAVCLCCALLSYYAPGVRTAAAMLLMTGAGCCRLPVPPLSLFWSAD
jgi:hypothetical protein